MKITQEHYDHMRAAIEGIVVQHPTWVAGLRADLKAGVIKADDPAKRLRWDLAHAASLTPWICTHIYPYANDDHIDTALRKIMVDIGRLIGEPA